MSEAATRKNWDVASSIMALVANLHRDPKKARPAKPSDFHPYYAQRDEPIKLPKRQAYDILKRTFIG